MNARRILISGILLTALTLLTAWIVRNTYWEDITLPTPLRGEAARDPFYAAKRLVRQLGGTASEATLFEAPAPDSVIHLSNWNWNLGALRRRQLETWVDNGGRLVIDDSVYFLGDEFTAWSGLSEDFLDEDDPVIAEQMKALPDDEECRLQQRQGERVLADEAPRHSYLLCNFFPLSTVVSARPPQWLLRDEFGVHAVRVNVGKGSVTFLRAQPFIRRSLLREDHPELFAAVTQMRPGDHVLFVSEREHPSLLALTWRFGWPAVLIGAMALVLLLWRWGTRFGPLAAPSPAARRSLAEQIRGTGRFVLQRGSGMALLAASARALHAAARRSLPGYAALPGTQQISAIAAATGADETALAQALGMRPEAGTRSLIAAIVHLETIRRRILSSQPRRTHGS